MPNLYIVRGLPNSGKTPKAKALVNNGFADIHYEADMFFMHNGVRLFDGSRIREAHAWCQKKVMEALLFDKSVVVANTFTTIREMEPYFDMAKRLKVPVTVLEANAINDYGDQAVPSFVMQRMKSRWEEYPPNHTENLAKYSKVNFN